MKPQRGSSLLLQHVEGVARLELSRETARRRLAGMLGSELTRLLMFALASGDYRARWRLRARRTTASSP
jgi:hypothetical protein